ncbi:SDR family oxidoreductase [Goodfellowiella coeruleoviolacea]|uniref:Nucleoside-diphosphate-sugar epimerase n=1 Tax=Goodfellowiella coeruleoviolacea TaxID=334858 RepID=A0AAE3GBK4_9PSEU|nr:NAD(P)H-binding protein [Goodfellowiella coeruleoviolacea]MCP2164247.1 Nucleoside-diphosphate-sugar epimerase [Goodfellowiella coeruleoviolacea]
MRVLVTGATGVLGSAVLPALREAGVAVRATSRKPRPDTGSGIDWITADLTTGAGVAEAVAEVDAVVHLAAAPYKGKYTDRVEIDGTRLLTEAAARAGVSHLLYTSIVGTDRVPWGYFQSKVRGEEVVRDAPLPWSILRATQFHAFVDRAFTMMAKLGVLITDPGIAAQPVAVGDVAERIRDRIERGPSGSVENFGGPEVLAFDEAARQWLEVRGTRRPVLRLTLPGTLGAAFRGGHLTTDAQPTGTVSWQQYLVAKYR